MKTYEAIYEPNKNKGVYGISLVKNPAMEGFFVALSKDEKIQLKTLDEEKRILVGLVLEPNKPIYRNQNGEEFNIVFSEQTVEDLCYGFTKNKNNSNSTIEHDENKKIVGVTFVENWLVRDEKIDTTVALGLNCKKGSWASVVKVDSDEIWEEYVKTGQVQGFSIDAMLSLKEVNLKSEIEMSEQKSIAESISSAIENGFNQFITAFKSNDKNPVNIQLGEIKTKDGNLKVMFEGEMMALGAKVWVLAEDGTEVPLPVGEYPLENDMILVVTEEGVVGELKEPTTEEKPAEMETQTGNISEEQAGAIAQAVKSVLIKYAEEQKTVIEEIKSEFTKQISDLKTDYENKILEFSKQPASKPRISMPQNAEPKTAKERILQTIQNQ
jgi:hypothetical protein